MKLNLPLSVRSRIVWVVKLCVIIGLGGFLFEYADWSMIGGMLSKIQPGVIVAAYILMLLSAVISTYRWQILLKLHYVDFSFSELHRYTLIAIFCNNFFPTSIGGDGYRIYKTYDNSRSTSSSVIAVVMGRLLGIVALLGLGYFYSFIVYKSRGDEMSESLIVAGTIGVIVTLGVVLLLISLNGVERLKRWQDKPRMLSIILEHGKDYVRQPAASAQVILVSILFHVHNSMVFYVLLRYGVGVDITIPELFVVLTLVELVGVLPISFNGLGVVDITFVFLLGLYGIDKDSALTVMLIRRLLLILVSLIGAGLFLSERKDLTVQSQSSRELAFRQKISLRQYPVLSDEVQKASSN